MQSSHLIQSSCIGNDRSTSRDLVPQAKQEGMAARLLLLLLLLLPLRIPNTITMSFPHVTTKDRNNRVPRGGALCNKDQAATTQHPVNANLIPVPKKKPFSSTS